MYQRKFAARSAQWPADPIHRTRTVHQVRVCTGSGLFLPADTLAETAHSYLTPSKCCVHVRSHLTGREVHRERVAVAFYTI